MSRIFDWFREDWTSGNRGFEGRSEPIRAREQYFAAYAALLADDPRHQKRLLEQKAEIRFLEYDWALNAFDHRSLSQ